MKTTKQFKMVLIALLFTANSFSAMAQCLYICIDRDLDGWISNENVTTCTSFYGSAAIYYSTDPCVPHDGGWDCDDLDFYVNPYTNCSGQFNVANYVDGDGDGFGIGGAIMSQSLHAGYASNNLDCNDDFDFIHPGASEICDGLDNDCDGEVDATNYYTDADGDGYGDAGSTPIMVNCGTNQPTGTASNNSDPDDNDPNNFPGSNDDNDNDGYSISMGDCNDNDANVHPGASDSNCDGVDNDCDGTVDDNASYTTYWLDADDDGWGNPASGSITTCDGQPATGNWVSHAINTSDCNDSDPNIHPGAAEVCDGIDSNCDGNSDVDLKLDWYEDLDGDDHGNYYLGAFCDAPVNGAELHGDCNDVNPNINPGASELCDGLDNNCDGSIDEGVTRTYYLDNDGDGWGDPGVTAEECVAPSGYVPTADDCDDAHSDINPSETELANGIDDDCDGVIDGLTGTSTTNIGSTSARLNWVPISGATGYHIQYRKTSTTMWKDKIINSGTASFSDINGLRRNTDYLWQVRVRISGSGSIAVYGPYTSILSFTTLTARLAGEALTEAESTEIQNAEVDIYPNPANQSVHIVFATEEENAYSINFIDMLGREILKHNGNSIPGKNDVELSLEKLPSGIYSVQFIQDGIKEVKKLLVE